MSLEEEPLDFAIENVTFWYRCGICKRCYYSLPLLKKHSMADHNFEILNSMFGELPPGAEDGKVCFEYLPFFRIPEPVVFHRPPVDEEEESHCAYNSTESEEDIETERCYSDMSFPHRRYVPSPSSEYPVQQSTPICSICSKKFKAISILNFHLKKFHKVSEGNSSAEQEECISSENGSLNKRSAEDPSIDSITFCNSRHDDLGNGLSSGQESSTSPVVAQSKSKDNEEGTSMNLSTPEKTKNTDSEELSSPILQIKKNKPSRSRRMSSSSESDLPPPRKLRRTSKIYTSSDGEADNGDSDSTDLAWGRRNLRPRRRKSSRVLRQTQTRRSSNSSSESETDAKGKNAEVDEMESDRSSPSEGDLTDKSTTSEADKDKAEDDDDNEEDDDDKAEDDDGDKEEGVNDKAQCNNSSENRSSDSDDLFILIEKRKDDKAKDNTKRSSDGDETERVESTTIERSDKNNKCGKCPMTFASPNELIRHMEVGHQIKNEKLSYLCGYCKKRFQSKHARKFNKHVQAHKKELELAQKN